MSMPEDHAFQYLNPSERLNTGTPTFSNYPRSVPESEDRDPRIAEQKTVDVTKKIPRPSHHIPPMKIVGSLRTTLEKKRGCEQGARRT